jgi:hypothetical protein
VLFAALNALGNTTHVWLGALIGALYFGTGALVTLRGGLLAFAIGTFVSSLLFDVIVTRETSAWYVANTALLVAAVVGLAVWGFYRAAGGLRATPWLSGSSASPSAASVRR